MVIEGEHDAYSFNFDQPQYDQRLDAIMQSSPYVP